MQQATWVVIADSSRARIFETNTRRPHLLEIEDFVNSGGRSADIDLRTDERGRFYGKGERNQAHTADPQVSPVEHENEIFSRTLTRYLGNALQEHRYKQLYVIAAPKFLGLLRRNLDKAVQESVVEELPNDISNFTTAQIEEFMKQKIDFT
jgi:protein required for attachment to host cells